MRDQHIGIYVGSKIPRLLKDAINKAIEKGYYLNHSDFIRDAIKEKLQREGFAGSVTSTEENKQGN
jgi:Arc/MetJ-type ribon-helix-helix transcriptional regulator